MNLSLLLSKSESESELDHTIDLDSKKSNINEENNETSNNEELKYLEKKRLKLMNQTEEFNKSSYLYNSYNEELRNYFLKNCVVDKITDNIFENFEPIESKLETKEDIKIKIDKYLKETFEQIYKKFHKKCHCFEKMFIFVKSNLQPNKIKTELIIRNNQYILDKSTGTWNGKTWNGLTSFRGLSIWNDGENIYYSNGSSQYVLGKVKKLGTSACKDFTEKVQAGNTDLVTSGGVYDSISWTLFGTYDIVKDAAVTPVGLPAWVKEILIYYGYPNNSKTEAETVGIGSLMMIATVPMDSVLPYFDEHTENIAGILTFSYNWYDDGGVLNISSRKHDTRISIYVR
jgi:hypothetical protein